VQVKRRQPYSRKMCTILEFMCTAKFMYKLPIANKIRVLD